MKRKKRSGMRVTVDALRTVEILTDVAHAMGLSVAGGLFNAKGEGALFSGGKKFKRSSQDKLFRELHVMLHLNNMAATAPPRQSRKVEVKRR